MKIGKRWIIIFAGAIIVVLLLRGFLFTTYSIPSSGMENTLFQGDRILVNKWSYGLRTPLMALFSYHRWFPETVKPGDIAVFNNPASNKPVIAERNVFIGRCIGVPGDTLWVDSLFSIHSSQDIAGPDRKGLYSYPKNKKNEVDSLIHILGIENNPVMGLSDCCYVRSFSRYEYYLLDQALYGNNWIIPLGMENKAGLKPVIIPGKGKTIEINPWNVTLIRNTILLHEGEPDAAVKKNALYINNQPVSSYTFKKDYYWMASNNSVSLSDSRLFGFVPHDHLIGKAWMIWFSKEANSDIRRGYRWNRFFTTVQ
ncbi:MAG: signal peptidase I [Bacteroides sp.]|nr:signal peptidase I [Bacteroides sp.]